MTVNLVNVTPTATRRFRESYRVEVAQVLNDLNLTLYRFTDGDGTLMTRYRPTILKSVGDRVQRLYVGSDLRSAYGDDGQTPRSPYATLLNRAFVEVTAATVLRYQTQLRNTLPNDVYQRLQSGTQTNVVTELLGSLVGGTVDFITPFSWVDSNGHQLSDRIWRTSLDVRRSVDALVSRAIREGWSVRQLSSTLERYLQPDQTEMTKLPYGTSASYPAMRLARTEIARAMNEVSLVSLKLHPYYDLVDVVRSGRGDPKCPICQRHATISISGARVRPPYNLDDVPSVPLHPHCLCHYEPNSDEPINSERLRVRLGELEPFMNPASGDSFIRLLLGAVLSTQLPDILASLNSFSIE